MVNKSYLPKFLIGFCVHIAHIFWEILNPFPDPGMDKYAKEAGNRSGPIGQSHKIEI